MNKKIIDIITRYLIIILVAFPNLFLFYFIFTPLTIYPIYLVLKVFYDVILIQSTLFFNGSSVEIIKACVAGSAYYLLLALNLSIPKINLRKRLKMLLFAFSSLLIFNLLRIFILIGLSFIGLALFDITHQIFWYGLNTLVVVGIWFAEVKLFSIKQIPVYSDMKDLYNKSLFAPKNKKSKTKVKAKSRKRKS